MNIFYTASVPDAFGCTTDHEPKDTQQHGNRRRAEKPPPSRQSLHHGSMTPSSKSKKQRIWFLKMGLHLAQEDSNLKRLSTLCVLGEDHESGVPGSVLWKVSTAFVTSTLIALLTTCPTDPVSGCQLRRVRFQGPKNRESDGRNGREGRSR